MEKPWVVPESWVWTEIKSIGAVVSGGTPSTKEPSFWGDEVNWISPADLTGYTSKNISKGAKSITRRGLDNSSAKLMPAGSVHFSSRAPIGYVAISSEPLCTNQGFKSLVPATGVFNDYLYYYFKASKQLVEERATGTTFKEISGTAFGKLLLPLAPKIEQHRIVAKIEELFSELDKGIESLKTAREQLKVYRQAVLKHAFEGKLTTQWREENKDKLETVDQLLVRIQKEREARYQQQIEEWEVAVKAWEGGCKEGKKPSKPAKLKYYSDPSLEAKFSLPELPENWVWVLLNNVVERIQIGPFGSLLHKEDYVRDQIPLVNPSHIKDMKIIPDFNLTVSKQKLRGLTKYVMKQGDIVVGRRGEMGRCAVVSNIEKGWLCGTGSLFVRVLPSSNPEFFCYILSSRRVRDFLSDSSIGTTMQNLNQKILQNVPVPVCGPLEQVEIVNEIKKQISILEAQEKDIEDNLERSETLRQSILKKAFSGQLVAQDPNDEPASILLERIKAEKARQKPRKKTAKKRRTATV